MNTRAEKFGRVFSLCFAAFNALTLCLAVGGLLQVRGRFAEVFKDLQAGAALPTLTSLFLGVPGPVVVGVAGLLLALLIAKEWLRPVWVPLVLNSVWLALGSACALLFVLAMLLPLLSIVTQVGQ